MEQFGKLEVSRDRKILNVYAGSWTIGREFLKKDYIELLPIFEGESMLAKVKEENNYKTYFNYQTQSLSMLLNRNNIF